MLNEELIKVVRRMIEESDLPTAHKMGIRNLLIDRNSEVKSASFSREADDLLIQIRIRVRYNT
jgi:hypothetical protein